MNDLRERAEFWGVDPEPLIQAVESAMRDRRYWELRKPLIASAEPADCKHRLKQAHKAIAALPLRARDHLHWHLADRIACDARLGREQVRHLMQADLLTMILDALAERFDSEVEDRQQEFIRLVLAWKDAGGEVEIDGRYDGDLIEFLGIAYQYLGETLTADAIRLRLDRAPRRGPPETEG
ncbi:hypothetical protein [Pseudomonas sp. VI4.1]|uniref:hypothetical protein n=1 Tax=Pseudomonas sp. VI4.1 TaxID=1941346 RepID=UPI0009CF5FEE|nr:hypothetical protein [Pseudomonas sp. VI4.1]OPK06777.1 hypothetical protein BZ163_29685 [Pseudomonas sp. VI4.1]